MWRCLPRLRRDRTHSRRTARLVSFRLLQSLVAQDGADKEARTDEQLVRHDHVESFDSQHVHDDNQWINGQWILLFHAPFLCRSHLTISAAPPIPSLMAVGFA